jgi:hypothetical protein
MAFDKEHLNYLEAASLYTISAAGELNRSILETLYNHAQDDELRDLIKHAIERQTVWMVEKVNAFLKNGGADLPAMRFANRTLHKAPLDIPADARLSDEEIALVFVNIARASQMAVFTAMQNTYHPEIATMYRKALDSAFDFNYRLLQVMLTKGWLPHIAKVEH